MPSWESPSGSSSSGSEKARFTGSVWMEKPRPEALENIMHALRRKISRHMPPFVQRFLDDTLYHEKGLPFDPDLYDLDGRIGSGGQSRVYLLQSKKEGVDSLALKVTRQRKQGEDPMPFIENLKKEYEHVREIYDNVSDVVPPQYFIVLNDPLYKGYPAAAILQPFERGEMEDLFDLSVEDLALRAQKDDVFRKQLEGFCSATIHHMEERGEIIDILGKRNVSVVKSGNGTRLTIIDPHPIYSFDGRMIHKKDRDGRLGARVAFLQNIMEKIS